MTLPRYALIALLAMGSLAAPAASVEADKLAIRHLELEWLDHESDRATLERILADDSLPRSLQEFFSPSRTISIGR